MVKKTQKTETTLKCEKSPYSYQKDVLAESGSWKASGSRRSRCILTNSNNGYTIIG